jgi:hypothetical protein
VCSVSIVSGYRLDQWYSTGGTGRHLRGYVDYTICITCIMYQQLWGYKVEEKSYVGVREQKRLNTTGLDDRAIEVRSPAGAEDFSSSLCVQTGSGAHPACNPMGTGGPFPVGKAQPGRDADHSPHLVPRSRKNRRHISSRPKRPYGV